MKKEIQKLEEKKILSYKELENLFMGYLHNKISDELMTHVLKLICKNSLTEKEIFDLTDIFIKSGEVYPKNSSFIDKHSTGGVGDKTTLIILPILASLGVKISKMSGKALGYTGGTIDKLNSIGVKTNLTKEEFYNSIGHNNMVIAEGTKNICPLDKKVYALRDVTGTTKSVPLIAVSIMSKKIASGAGKILIDIKVGKGALIENKKLARELANIMIKIGKKYDREVICIISRMDNPLGNNVGNKLEVLEAVDILKNQKHNDLSELCIEISSIMYSMSKKVKKETARKKVLSVLENKKAYEAFSKFIKYQGGKIDEDLPKPILIKSKKAGYIKSINSMIIGSCSMNLGAGRCKKEDEIDYSAGIILEKIAGDYVKKGDVLCKLYGKKIDCNRVYQSYKITKIKPINKKIIIDIIK